MFCLVLGIILYPKHLKQLPVSALRVIHCNEKLLLLRRKAAFLYEHQHIQKKHWHHINSAKKKKYLVSTKSMASQAIGYFIVIILPRMYSLLWLRLQSFKQLCHCFTKTSRFILPGKSALQFVGSTNEEDYQLSPPVPG